MVVLDASAILAVLLDEPGADFVIPQMRGAHVSIVNVCEVLTKAVEQGARIDAVERLLGSYQYRIRSFREPHAAEVARLRPLTRHRGLGLGDRACLAQARFSQMPVLTGERKWTELDLGLDIRLIR